MALENLKSIFAEGAGNNNSQIRDRYTDTSIYPRPEVEAVNFFGPSNSYFQPLDRPIDGFTLNFNNPGYAVGDGFLGDSNLIKYIFEIRNFSFNLLRYSPFFELKKTNLKKDLINGINFK